MTTLDILAISGSLRARSNNTEVLRALALLAPVDVRVSLHPGLDGLPHFNPDMDEEGMTAPDAVAQFRERIGAADALFICSPEYAHGVPGVLKNALDWLVSAPEIVHKPIGLINASPRSTHAYSQLAEILRTMSTHLVPAASITLPLAGGAHSADSIVAQAVLADQLRGAIDALAASARTAERSTRSS